MSLSHKVARILTCASLAYRAHIISNIFAATSEWIWLFINANIFWTALEPHQFATSTASLFVSQLCHCFFNFFFGKYHFKVVHNGIFTNLLITVSSKTGSLSCYIFQCTPSCCTSPKLSSPNFTISETRCSAQSNSRYSRWNISTLYSISLW